MLHSPPCCSYPLCGSWEPTFMSKGSESRLCHIFLLTRATHPSLMSFAVGPCSKKNIMLPGGLLKGILGVAFSVFTCQLQFLDTYVCLLQMKYHRNASDSQYIPCRTVASFLGHCLWPVWLQHRMPLLLQHVGSWFWTTPGLFY